MKPDAKFERPTGHKYLTFTQLREKLGGRARSSIYLDLSSGRLPKPIKLGGRLYWCEQTIDTFLLGPEYGEAAE